VWAENAKRVDAVIVGRDGEELGSHPLQRDAEGYFGGTVPGIEAGARYMYRLDGEKLRPDPASRYQPSGVHGPSQVVDSEFAWSDRGWQGVPLEEMVIYEMHLGTFSPEGTFEAVIGKLPYLKTLGVTAIEMMPVADFPGNRNWGYDGAYLYAPARAYGGPGGLKKLVDAAHAEGLAVLLDVVYNHLGPDGNYLRDFSEAYFTSEKKTPWGDAINFANRHVRDFFAGSALYWLREYHIDGLRLDATHAILDDNEEHILAEIARRAKDDGGRTMDDGVELLSSVARPSSTILIAEDERNEARLIMPQKQGGMVLDAVWADDFHHLVRVALAGDREGYYMDFTGSAADLADTLNHGWLYRGQRSKYLKRKRGTDASQFDPEHFVYCIQNHDQVGNRPFGDRLNASVGLDAYNAASALLLLSPYTPLLFQGQEWAASTPFLYFTDHNPELGRLVTEGRRAEFAHFEGFKGEDVPDPQALDTFLSSKLSWDEVRSDGHMEALELYRNLLTIRRRLLPPNTRRRRSFSASPVGKSALAMRYTSPQGRQPPGVLVLVNLGGKLKLSLDEGEMTMPPPGQEWSVAFPVGEWHASHSDKGVRTGQVMNSLLATSSPGALILQATSL
jgi:maltooligosyltrehalose trehalohydrolase